MARPTLAIPDAPEFALFAREVEAAKLLIVALEQGVIDTIFRALRATLTPGARAIPPFAGSGVADDHRFFDFLRTPGVEQSTIRKAEASPTEYGSRERDA